MNTNNYTESEYFKRNTVLVDKCTRLAEKLHDGQFRDDGRPYIEHPMAVCKLGVSAINSWYKNNPSISHEDYDNLVCKFTCVAILHDVLEDTDMNYDTLVEYVGEEIAKYVSELTLICSNGANKHQELIKKARGYSDLAKFVKICDRYSNVFDSLITPAWTPERTKSYARKGMELIQVMQPLPDYSGDLQIMAESLFRKIA